MLTTETPLLLSASGIDELIRWARDEACIEIGCDCQGKTAGRREVFREGLEMMVLAITETSIMYLTEDEIAKRNQDERAAQGDRRCHQLSE